MEPKIENRKQLRSLTIVLARQMIENRSQNQKVHKVQ